MFDFSSVRPQQKTYALSKVKTFRIFPKNRLTRIKSRLESDLRKPVVKKCYLLDIVFRIAQPSQHEEITTTKSEAAPGQRLPAVNARGSRTRHESKPTDAVGSYRWADLPVPEIQKNKGKKMIERGNWMALKPRKRIVPIGRFKALTRLWLRHKANVRLDQIKARKRSMEMMRSLSRSGSVR